MHHRIQLDLEIKFSSRWHAGSGEGSFMTDRLIRRNARNLPFIPASTLKGTVRQSCEKLCRTIGFPDPSDPHQSDLSQCQSFVPFKKMLSPIDRLFGTKFEPSGLFFRDAHLKHDECMTFTRNRTARYRVLNTAKDKHLFGTEYATPELFETQIDGWHTNLATFGDEYPPYAYCLLISGILALERLGGDKSTGSGWLNAPIYIRNIKYNGLPVNLDDDFFELLNPEFYQQSRGEL